MEQLLVDNLRLLGYGSNNPTPFKLDTNRCKKQFKECWPIQQPIQRDKYHTALLLWLNELNLFENETLKKSSLKSMNETKFYKYLWALSKYVLRKGIKEVHFDYQVEPNDRSIYMMKMQLKLKCGQVLAKIKRWEEREKEWRVMADGMDVVDNSMTRDDVIVDPKTPLEMIRKIWMDLILRIEFDLVMKPRLTWSHTDPMQYKLDIVDSLVIQHGLQSLRTYVENHMKSINI
jgi:hypothetical protein